MKQNLVTKFVTVFVLIALIVALSPVPAYAAGPLPPTVVPIVVPEGKIPPLPHRAAVEKFATQVSHLLILGKDGKLSLPKGELTSLNSEQSLLLNRFVNDINAGKIGIAIRTKDGTVVYGNSLAASQIDGISIENSLWRDGWGVNFYLDSWWTNQLINLSGWAIGVIAGVIASVFVVGSGRFVSLVWKVIWAILRPHLPTSFTFHLQYPYWSGGHLVFQNYVQPWRNGYWYNGRWFYTGAIVI